MASRLSWFATSRGKMVVRGTIAAIAVGSPIVVSAPHILGLSYYKEMVSMYRFGIELPLSNYVKNLFEKVQDDLKITESERFFIKPFTVFGFDVFHAGAVSTYNGAIIGIPISFGYMTEKDVDRDIKVGQKAVDWESEAGSQLSESLVLSENAKKFAIAREIYHVGTSYVYLVSLTPTALITLYHIASQNLNKRLNLFQRPPFNRYILYSLLSLMGLASYVFIRDFANVYYDNYTDDMASNVNIDYLRGGVEFYEQQLKRNQQLRKLLEDKGEELYSVTGNENFFIRQKRMPLIRRRDFLVEKLKAVESGRVLTKEEKESYFLGVKIIDKSSAFSLPPSANSKVETNVVNQPAAVENNVDKNISVQ